MQKKENSPLPSEDYEHAQQFVSALNSIEKLYGQVEFQPRDYKEVVNEHLEFFTSLAQTNQKRATEFLEMHTKEQAEIDRIAQDRALIMVKMRSLQVSLLNQAAFSVDMMAREFNGKRIGDELYTKEDGSMHNDKSERELLYVFR